MKSYLISYDLRKPGQDYKDLIATLKSWGAVRVLLSEWVMLSDASATAIRDALTSFIDANDGLLVTGLTGEAAWRGLLCTHESMKAELVS